MSRYVGTCTWDDVPHLSAEQKAELWASIPAFQRDARTKGIPALGSGRIFPIAEEDITIDAFQIPPHFKLIGGLDFGWDHPTAAVRLAYDADADIVYVTNVYKKSEAIPAIHAASIKPWGADMVWAWPHDGLQHDKGSGEQLAEQYRKHGLNMRPERAQYANDRGNSVEAGLMDMLERMQTGRWLVFSHLKEWFEEFRLYHRKDGRVVKEYDDLMSASRYALMDIRFARPAEKKQGLNLKVPRVPSGAWA